MFVAFMSGHPFMYIYIPFCSPMYATFLSCLEALCHSRTWRFLSSYILLTPLCPARRTGASRDLRSCWGASVWRPAQLIQQLGPTVDPVIFLRRWAVVARPLSQLWLWGCCAVAAQGPPFSFNALASPSVGNLVATILGDPLKFTLRPICSH